MQYQMFSEVRIKENIAESNLSEGMTGIIVDYCPRPNKEDGYILEVLNEDNMAYDVVALAASKLEPVQRDSRSETLRDRISNINQK